MSIDDRGVELTQRMRRHLHDSRIGLSADRCVWAESDGIIRRNGVFSRWRASPSVSSPPSRLLVGRVSK